jgi:hypothetical protein
MLSRAVAITITLLVAACAPSRQSKTAGAIGCPPSEVEVSDEDSSSGFGSSSQTWVATCRGQRFICSENAVGPAIGPKNSQNLSCTAELGSAPASISQNSGASSLQGGAAKPGPKAPPIEAPKMAAGFDFGAAPADIQTTCENAGKTWTSKSPKFGVCSGPAAEVGFEATVRIDFCYAQSCIITLEHRPESNWITAFGDLKQKLSEKYGSAEAITSPGIPENCRKEEQFVQCLENEGLRLGFRWEWPTKQQITLAVGKPEDGNGAAALRIKYVTPATRLRAKSDAL